MFVVEYVQIVIMDNTLSILSHFSIEQTHWIITSINTGWINTTYKVTKSGEASPRYILQCVNHQVFKDVDLLQNNIAAVTNHIRGKLIEKQVEDIDRRVIRLIPCNDGKLYYFDGERYWRMMAYISDSFTKEELTLEAAYSTGRTFGEFQSYLVDIKEELGETIPNFHNMEYRYLQFTESIEKNLAGRVNEVLDLIEELKSRADEMCKAQRLHREEKLPKRINHCDTKINNILFNSEGEAICVIDLDTVMPNFVTSDYGDFMRTAGNMGAEDDPDLNNVRFNIPIFKAYTKGYLESASGFLLPLERELLPFGAKLMTYMQTVRFLTDYLNGDTYYKILHPTHNLQRSRAQFALLKSMEANEETMNEYIRSLV
ncbi:aminoglycoside phosphotransferase family protein [Porphyromonadaceae bacterium]